MMVPIRRYRGRRNTYTGALGDELLVKLAEALEDDAARPPARPTPTLAARRGTAETGDDDE